MLSGDDGKRTSSRHSVDEIADDIAEYDGHKYSIRALRLDGDFDIGISHTGGGSPPAEIVPPEVYETVESSVRSEVDIEEVRRQTTPEEWPQLGTIRLEARDDESLAVDVELVGTRAVE